MARCARTQSALLSPAGSAMCALPNGVRGGLRKGHDFREILSLPIFQSRIENRESVGLSGGCLDVDDVVVGQQVRLALDFLLSVGGGVVGGLVRAEVGERNH